MGTLHEVRQLKPRSISGGAFLRVKPEKSTAFVNQFDTYVRTHFSVPLFSSNMDLQISEDGKVLKHGMNQTDRMIDLGTPGTYVLIQSGSKYGFENEFTTCLNHFSEYFEDNLFYVLYDSVINRFEIKNGALIHSERNDFVNWNYEFDGYVEATYADQEALVTDYFTDKMCSLKVIGDEMMERDCDLDEYYECEEYKEFLEKLERYTETNQNENASAMIAWLKDKIANYKPFEK